LLAQAHQLERADLDAVTAAFLGMMERLVGLRERAETSKVESSLALSAKICSTRSPMA
jgi:hypothetical protein